MGTQVTKQLDFFNLSGIHCNFVAERYQQTSLTEQSLWHKIRWVCFAILNGNSNFGTDVIQSQREYLQMVYQLFRRTQHQSMWWWKFTKTTKLGVVSKLFYSVYQWHMNMALKKRSQLASEVGMCLGCQREKKLKPTENKCLNAMKHFACEKGILVLGIHFTCWRRN